MILIFEASYESLEYESDMGFETDSRWCVVCGVS